MFENCPEGNRMNQEIDTYLNRVENVTDVLSLSRKGNAMMWSTPGY